MTPKENAMLARLDGYEEAVLFGVKGWARKPDYSKNGIDECNGCFHMGRVNYDDLNNLMPLAWKNGVSVYFQDTGVCVVITRLTREAVALPEEFKPSIQQALLAIAREKYGE